MKNAEQDYSVGSVFLSSLNTLYQRGQLERMLMPQLESRTRVKVDSFTDFELLNDQERVERIRLVLTQFTGVDEKHDYKCRDRALVEYRQLLAYLLRRYTSLSLEEIGFIIGRKDHATTIHSVKTIKNAIEWDKGYAAKVERIINEL